jgi:hypothetical protein
MYYGDRSQSPRPELTSPRWSRILSQFTRFENYKIEARETFLVRAEMMYPSRRQMINGSKPRCVKSFECESQYGTTMCPRSVPLERSQKRKRAAKRSRINHVTAIADSYSQ